jgi:hypothetical protein
MAANSGMPGFAWTASQIASSESPMSPAAPGRNQRSRADDSERLAFGERAKSAARDPPINAPVVLAIKSAMLAYRVGRNICSVSIASDRSAAVTTAIASRRAPAPCRGISPTKNPNGR